MKTCLAIIGAITSLFIVTLVALTIFVFSHADAREAYSCVQDNVSKSQAEIEKICTPQLNQ